MSNVLINSGTNLTLDNGYIDGLPGPAIDVEASTGPVTGLLIENCLLAGNTYNNDGSINTVAPFYLIQISRSGNPQAQVSGSIINNQFDPHTEVDGGVSSIGIGITCAPNMVRSNNTFASTYSGKTAGNPVAETLFNDAAQVIGPVGIASAEAFGADSLGGQGTISPGGIPSSEIVAEDMSITNFASLFGVGGIASSEAFGTADIVGAGVTQTRTMHGIATSEAFGIPTLVKNAGPYTIALLTGVDVLTDVTLLTGDDRTGGLEIGSPGLGRE